MTLTNVVSHVRLWLTPRRYVVWVLPLLMFGLHTPILNLEIVGTHSWRQTMTATMARAFHREEAPTWMKPKQADRLKEDGVHLFEVPVLQWFIAKGWDLFGEQVWVLRLIMFGISLVSVWAMFGLARLLLSDDVLGAWAASALALSPLFFYYSWNPMPDNLALCLSLCTLLAYVHYLRTPRVGYLVAMGVLGMFAVLVKFPFILALFVIGLHATVRTLRPRASSVHNGSGESGAQAASQSLLARLLPAVVMLLAVVPGYLWYGVYITDNWYAQHMLFNVHQQLPYPRRQELLNLLVWNTHTWFIPLVLGWPWVVLAAWGLGSTVRLALRRKAVFGWLLLLFALTVGYYLADLHVISAIHDYYLLPFYLTTPLLVAVGSGALRRFSAGVLPLCTAIAVFACLHWGMAMWFRDGEADLPVVVHSKALSQITPYEDQILLTTQDQSPTFTLYHLEKNGIPVPYHGLEEAYFEAFIRENGLRYYYSSTPEWDERPEFQRFYKRKVAEMHGFRVWELKTPAELDAD